jgi:hypothetical protein
MSFGMTVFLWCIAGRKQRKSIVIRQSADKDSVESPLLPSPLSSLKIAVIPNFPTKKSYYLTETLSVEK